MQYIKYILIIIFNVIFFPYTTWANLSVEVTNCSTTLSNDGSIDLSVAGGHPPYDYSWSGPNQFESTSTDIYNLSPGEYCVTVTDAMCGIAELCTFVCSTISVTNPQISNPTTCSSSDGVIYFRFGNASGGFGPYTVLWNTGATTMNLDNLPAGIYSATFTDAIGCSAEVVYELTFNEAPEVYEVVDAGCAGANGGDVELIVVSQNPNPVFTYLWNTGATSDQINNVPPGMYNVTVTDITNGCSTVHYFEVPAIQGNGAPTISTKLTDACPGEASGSIELSIIGGTPPFGIEWEIPGNTNDRILDQLLPGNYCVTVTDACDTYVSCYDISSAPPIIVNELSSDACQNNDGSIQLNTTGGTPPYLYSWQSQSTGENGTTNNSFIPNLSAGSYSITITDDNDCTIITNIDVGGIIVDALNVVPGCSGELAEINGSVNLYPYGGTGPYMFEWENGSTLSSAQLPSGSNKVRVTDSNGCFVESTVFIPNGINLSSAFALDDPHTPFCFLVETCPDGSQFEGPILSTFYVPLNPSSPCSAGTIICPVGLDLPQLNWTVTDGVIEIGDQITQNPFSGACSFEATCEFMTDNGSLFASTAGGIQMDCECGENPGRFLDEREEIVFFSSLSESCCGAYKCVIIRTICSIDGHIVNERCEVAPVPLSDPNTGNFLNDEDVAFRIEQLYPNPFNDRFTILLSSYNSNTNITFSLVDMLGRVVLKREENILKGHNTITLDVSSSTPHGIYMLIVQDGKGNQVMHKLIHNKI